MDPTFLMSFMEITPLMIENKTTGTTINLTKFRNIVPKGLIYVSTMAGLPIKHIPTIIPKARLIKIQVASENFFLSFIKRSPSKKQNLKPLLLISCNLQVKLYHIHSKMQEVK